MIPIMPAAKIAKKNPLYLIKWLPYLKLEIYN